MFSEKSGYAKRRLAAQWSGKQSYLKSTNNLVPEYLSDLFVKNSALNTMRLRNTEADLRVPLFKTANGQKSISFRGPKIWNQLSSDVRLPPSLFTFKRRLKEVIEG